MAVTPTSDRQRLALWLLAVVLFAVLGFVVVAYVGTVMLGLFFYYVARPVYDRIRGVVPTRTLAAMVALLLFILPVVVLFAWTLGLAVQELLAFAGSEGFADYLALLEPYLELEALDVELDEFVRGLLAGDVRLPEVDLAGALSGVTGGILASVGVLGTVFIQLFVALTVGFYLLRDDFRLVAWAQDTVVPEASVLHAYFAAVDRDLKNVYFGNILNAFLSGVIAAVTYTLLNAVAPPGLAIPVATLLGVLTGAASLVPVVGIKLTYVPVLLYLAGMAALNDPATLWFPALFGVVSVVVVDVIPDLVLRPYVSGRTLHVGTLMVAYILGPLLFGWYGIFLGPLLLVAIVEFGRVVVPWLAAPPEDRPAARDAAFVEETGESRGTVESPEPAEPPEPGDEEEGTVADVEEPGPSAGDGTPGDGTPDDGPPPDGDASPED